MRSFIYLAALLSLLNAVVASPVACLVHPDTGLDASNILSQTGSASGPSILKGLSVTNTDNTRNSDSSSVDATGGNILNGVVGTQRGGNVLSGLSVDSSRHDSSSVDTAGGNILSGVVGTQRGGPLLSGVSVDSSRHESVQQDSSVGNTAKTDAGSSGFSLGNVRGSTRHDSTKTNTVFHNSVNHDSSDSTGLSLDTTHGNTGATGVSIPSLSTNNSRSGSTVGNVIATDNSRSGSTIGNVISTGSADGSGLSLGSGRTIINGDNSDSRSTSTDTKVGNGLHQSTSSSTTHRDDSNVTVKPDNGGNGGGDNVVSANNDAMTDSSRKTTVTTNGVNKDNTVTDRSGSQSGSCAL